MLFNSFESMKCYESCIICLRRSLFLVGVAGIGSAILGKQELTLLYNKKKIAVTKF